MTKYQTAYEGKIFQLKLFCGKEYPESPPSVKFQTRINMACVNPDTGVVSSVTSHEWNIVGFLCICVSVYYNKELYDLRLNRVSSLCSLTGGENTQWRTFWLN